ncbi:hypothetical protein FF36_04044 [Frankia torreyi]|uniref:Uncharacterized protein n=1 Tax=Frankia torreyi TaxID=1856 RepID=A0A0D8BDV1_9ACTN|nr:hypothetical protein FF36_04044 [Frankia torreyi]KQM03722.1 hypothetical protein FF86_103660 [Frankia sp. CpI1-P]
MGGRSVVGRRAGAAGRRCRAAQGGPRRQAAVLTPAADGRRPAVRAAAAGGGVGRGSAPPPDPGGQSSVTKVLTTAGVSLVPKAPFATAIWGSRKFRQVHIRASAPTPFHAVMTVLPT